MRGYDFHRILRRIYAFLCPIDLRIKKVSQNSSGLIGIKKVDRKEINVNLKQKAMTYIIKKLDPSDLYNLDPKQSTSTAIAPATNEQVAVLPDGSRDAEVVSGTFVPTIDATGNTQMEAHRHAARLRKTIETFNEDKQTFLEWLVVKFFTVLAYLLPPFVAWIVGQAIGDAWGGKLDWNNAWSVYSHVISISLEMMIPVLGYSETVALKRAIKDRSQMGWPIGIGLLFLALAIGNSFAQIYLIEGHIKLADSDTAGHISMIFRSFAPLVIDVIATIFLSIVTVRNLQKFLKDMQHKEAGIQAVARSEIAIDAAFNQASIDRENAAMQQERTRMDNELLRDLTKRRNRDVTGGDDDRKDSGRGGRHGGW
jgi:hypothetical protein